MRKLNIKNFLILEVLVLMSVSVLTDWIVAIIHGGTFTIFGLMVNGFETFIAAICYDYLEKIYNSKSNKINDGGKDVF